MKPCFSQPSILDICHMYCIGDIFESDKFDWRSLGNKWCDCNMTYTHIAQIHVFRTIKARDNSMIHPTSTHQGHCLTWNKHGKTSIPSSLWLFEELLSLLAQAEVVSFGATPVEGHDKSKLDDSSFHDLIYKTGFFFFFFFTSHSSSGIQKPKCYRYITARKSFLHLYLMLQAKAPNTCAISELFLNN